MRILLDTHLFYWSLFQPENVGTAVLAEIADPSNDVLFSAVAVWEIAIKTSLGRAGFDMDVSEIPAVAKASGFRELPVVSAVAARVANLPLHHRDPFDRLLIAQAMAEPAMLYTRDAQLEPYSDLVKRV